MIKSGTEPLLSVKNLSVRFESDIRNPFRIQDVSFDIHSNETLAIVGESGSGKTVTALTLLGLLPTRAGIHNGEIRFQGKKVTEDGDLDFAELRGKHIAMIFQEAHAALNPAFSIGTQILDVVQTHQQLSTELARKRVLALLTAVGLANHHFHAYPHQLSGGMAQRVMIALALSCQPELIIADEPTTALDVTTQIKILRLIKSLQKELHFALLLISHDISLVKVLADFILVMHNGRIVEKGVAGDLLSHPTQPYTQELLNSVFTIPAELTADGRWQT